MTAVITGERGAGRSPGTAWRSTSRTASSCSTTGSRAGLDAPAAHRQIPRLGARHQRISVPDRRARHRRAADHVAGLDHAVSDERVSSGVPDLDEMLGGQGFYRGSSVLVSGTAGSGKTSLATHFADAACRRGERCLYFAFEESPASCVRNMRSIGFDARPLGRERPPALQREPPDAVRAGDAPRRACIVRSSSSRRKRWWSTRSRACSSIGEQGEVHAMLLRLVDSSEERADHGVVHRACPRRPEIPSRPTSASRRSWTPGSCCATSRDRRRA